MPDLEVKAITGHVVHIVANSEPAVALLRMFCPPRPSVHRARARRLGRPSSACPPRGPYHRSPTEKEPINSAGSPRSQPLAADHAPAASPVALQPGSAAAQCGCRRAAARSRFCAVGRPDLPRMGLPWTSVACFVQGISKRTTSPDSDGGPSPASKRAPVHCGNASRTGCWSTPTRQSCRRSTSQGSACHRQWKRDLT
jgi:hypothetical protein